jgi:hypothetical protein
VDRNPLEGAVSATIKALIVATIAALPTWTWAPASAVVRWIWRGFRHA